MESRGPVVGKSWPLETLEGARNQLGRLNHIYLTSQHCLFRYATVPREHALRFHSRGFTETILGPLLSHYSDMSVYYCHLPYDVIFYFCYTTK